jgi:hypothetical protein
VVSTEGIRGAHDGAEVAPIGIPIITEFMCRGTFEQKIAVRIERKSPVPELVIKGGA